jgi:hypothetical protein
MKKAFYKTGLNQESDKKTGTYGNNTMLGTSSVIGRATNMSEAKEDESPSNTLPESNMGKLPESEIEARHARGHYKMSDYFGGGQNLNKEGIMSVLKAKIEDKATARKAKNLEKYNSIKKGEYESSNKTLNNVDPTAPSDSKKMDAKQAAPDDRTGQTRVQGDASIRLYDEKDYPDSEMPAGKFKAAPIDLDIAKDTSELDISAFMQVSDAFSRAAERSKKYQK